MLINTTDLVVPAGDINERDITIDLAAILRSEIRQDEVAIVTAAKAPELLAEFNRSWRDVHASIARLEAEKNKAEKAVKNRRGVLLLEVIPQRLEAMGVKSATDIREAIIDTDAEHSKLADRFDQLKAAIFYLKGKLESFENAYTSVKKLIGESTYNYSGNSRLSGDASNGGSRSAGAPRPGFGTPRYGND